MLPAKQIPLMYTRCGFGLYQFMRGGWGEEKICEWVDLLGFFNAIKYLFLIFQLRVYTFFTSILMICVHDLWSLVPVCSCEDGNVDH